MMSCHGFNFFLKAARKGRKESECLLLNEMALRTEQLQALTSFEEPQAVVGSCFLESVSKNSTNVQPCFNNI